MRGPSPAFFIPVAIIGLCGYAHVSHFWNPKSRSQTACLKPILLGLTAVYVAGVAILFGFWLKSESYIAFSSLFKLSWIGGLSIEGVLLEITFSNISSAYGILRKFRTLVVIIAPTAGILQVVGFGVSFHNDLQVVRFRVPSHNNRIGLYITFAGGCLFRVFAAVAYTILLTYKSARHRKPTLLAFINICAVSSCGLIIIINKDTFLPANCVFVCCVNIVLLVYAVLLRKKKSLSLHLSLESCNTDTREANISNAEKDLWELIFPITEQNHPPPPSLPQPPAPSVPEEEVKKIVSIRRERDRIFITYSYSLESIQIGTWANKNFDLVEVEWRQFTHCPGAMKALKSLPISYHGNNIFEQVRHVVEAPDKVAPDKVTLFSLFGV